MPISWWTFSRMRCRLRATPATARIAVDGTMPRADDAAWRSSALGVRSSLRMDAVSPPQSIWEIVGRLGLATLLGAAVGLNREWEGKPGRLRTHALVAHGGTLPTISGRHLAADNASATSRILHGITAGLSFTGAGLILHRPAAQD